MLAAAHGVYHMNYLQAVVIGLIQGIAELFPISSLGHTVLIPSWIGGSWATLVRQESRPESPYLAFVVGLHLATAFVLIAFYAREWTRLVLGFFRTLLRRKVSTYEERLAWLIVIATIPVGLLGLVLEHPFRVIFAKPLAAAVFLTINGFILLLGEYFHRHPRPSHPVALPEEQPGAEYETRGIGPALPERGEGSRARRLRDERIVPMDAEAERTLARIGVPSAFIIGAAQTLALLAGISREGVAMVGGMFRGLNRENALRFSFLLSTPVILAAGALKVPDLVGKLGAGTHGQIIAGSIAAVLSSLFAVLFLSRYFKTRTLFPFAFYSILFGLASVIRFGIF